MLQILYCVQKLKPFIEKNSPKIFLFFATFLSSSLAFAQASESPVGQGLGYVVKNFVYGADGITIATIAVAGVGLACMKHVIEWKYFFYTIGGISIVFGAPAIVQGIKALVST